MADTVTLGGGGVDGYFGKNPDWSKIKVKTGRTIWSSYDDNTLQAWLVEDTNSGGVELAGGNYANPIQVAGNELPEIAGYFVDGFEFKNPNQVGIDASGNSWRYVGTSPLPYTITAGTDPNASGDYEKVFESTLQNLNGLEQPSDLDKVYERRVSTLERLSDTNIINSVSDGNRFYVDNFYALESTSGGCFYWDDNRNKADHNGGTVLAPEAIADWDGTHADLNTLLSWSGSGTGCYVRSVLPVMNIDLEWFGAVLDDIAKSNHLSFNAAYSLATSAKMGITWRGDFSISQTIDMPSNVGCKLSGIQANRQSGSVTAPSRMIWTGGATPMMTVSSTLNTFKDFSVENRGTATCWQSLTTGSINQVYERLYFLNVSSHVPFTDAVILSNGARLGYSQFKNIIATQPSENFLLIKDSSTTGVTPFSFTDRCIFRSSAGLFNIVKVENSTIEGVKFELCTLIQTTGTLVIVDTDTNPTAQPINVLTTVDCEFDTDTGSAISTDRYYRLTNVANIVHDRNNHTKGGAGSVYELVNSNVCSFKGNYGRSLNYFFVADDSSKVRGVGYNDLEWSSIDGILDNPNCTVEELTQQTTILIDGIGWGSSETAYYTCELTQDIPYQFSLDISKPQNMEPGQVFYITLKNTSGGAVQDPTFSNSRFKYQVTPAITSPANNRQSTIGFRFNGTHAVQITQQTPDCYL